MVDIGEWVRGFPRTVKLYLGDPYLRCSRAEVLGIARAVSYTHLTLPTN